MNKITLIKKFKTKSPSRKKYLFDMYQVLICSNKTAENIVEEIHEDLEEENMLKVTDIYYCRHYFKQKHNTSETFLVNSVKIAPANVFEEMKWTNPDEIERVVIKSKFAK